jgi:coiled-coil domain-containing protein 61
MDSSASISLDNSVLNTSTSNLSSTGESPLTSAKKELIFHNVSYILSAHLYNSHLTIEAEQSATGQHWFNNFTIEHIELITRQTGNFKSFSVFSKMLLSALVQHSDSVFIDLLTYQDLEMLYNRKANNSASASNASSRPKSTKQLNKRYLILTYVAEFDRVHYPLPLQFDINPSQYTLQNTISRLVTELQNAKTGNPSTNNPSNNNNSSFISSSSNNDGHHNNSAEIAQYQRELNRFIEENRKLKAALKQSHTASANSSPRGNHSALLEELKAEIRQLKAELAAKSVENHTAGAAEQTILTLTQSNKDLAHKIKQLLNDSEQQTSRITTERANQAQLLQGYKKKIKELEKIVQNAELHAIQLKNRIKQLENSATSNRSGSNKGKPGSNFSSEKLFSRRTASPSYSRPTSAAIQRNRTPSPAVSAQFRSRSRSSSPSVTLSALNSSSSSVKRHNGTTAARSRSRNRQTSVDSANSGATQHNFRSRTPPLPQKRFNPAAYIREKAERMEKTQQKLWQEKERAISRSNSSQIINSAGYRSRSRSNSPAVDKNLMRKSLDSANNSRNNSPAPRRNFKVNDLRRKEDSSANSLNNSFNSRQGSARLGGNKQFRGKNGSENGEELSDSVTNPSSNNTSYGDNYAPITNKANNIHNNTNSSNSINNNKFSQAPRVERDTEDELNQSRGSPLKSSKLVSPQDIYKLKQSQGQYQVSSSATRPNNNNNTSRGPAANLSKASATMNESSATDISVLEPTNSTLNESTADTADLSTRLSNLQKFLKAEKEKLVEAQAQ